MSETNRRTLLATASAALLAGVPSAGHARRFAQETDGAGTEPPAVDVFAGAPVVGDIALAPSGEQVAFLTDTGDVKSLIFFDVRDNVLHRIAIGKGKTRGLMWADEDHLVLSYSQTTSLKGGLKGNHEVYLASVINIHNGKVTNLFSNMTGFYSIIADDVRRIRVDGHDYIAAASYRIDQDHAYPLCLYRFSPDKTAGQSLCEMPEQTEDFVLTPEGRVVAYSTFDEAHKLWSLFYNVGKPGGSNVFKPVFESREAIDTPSLRGLGRDGLSVVVQLGGGTQAGEYHEISADGAVSGPLDASGSVSSSPLFHPTTGRLAGFLHHDDWFTYAYDDALLKSLSGAVTTAIGEDARCSIAGFADDPRKMIIYGEGEGNAGTYYYADFSAGNVHQIATRYVGLPGEWVSEKQAIDYTAGDGLAIHAYLTLPPNRPEAKNLPLIVLPHGGPQARDYIDFDWQAQCLASRGYAVLQPNFRGSTGYGKAFVDAAHGEFGRKMQTDLSDGVRYLAARGIIDPKRTAIMGASYGGYAALAGATLDTGVYACAVAIAGISDPESFIDYVVGRQTESLDSSAELYWRRLMGDSGSYSDISPFRQAARTYCPILLLHGMDDTVVPIEQSQHMEKALKRTGKDVEFVTYKGQDHWETIGSTRVEMMKAALAFIQKHVPPV